MIHHKLILDPSSPAEAASGGLLRDQLFTADGAFETGVEIGRGAQGTVYRLHRDRIAKVFFDGVSDDLVDREYAHSLLAHTSGIPTWKVEKIVRRGGSRTIIGSFETGRRLSQQLRRTPHRGPRLMRDLATLHARIHGAQIDTTHEWRYPSRKRQTELLSPLMDGPTLERALDALARSERGFCHTDLSGSNLLCRGEHLIVLDWARSGYGPMTGDVGRTAAFILAAEFRRPLPVWINRMFRRRLTSTYLAAYAARTGRPLAELRLWAAVFLMTKLRRDLGKRRLDAIRAEAQHFCDIAFD